jgi:hypothetical protein
VSNNRIYVAAGEYGLLVVYSVPNVQFAVQVDATPAMPFTVEAASSLNQPTQWIPILTTNSSTMPFRFTDFDVLGPQKFCRVREL